MTATANARLFAARKISRLATKSHSFFPARRCRQARRERTVHIKVGKIRGVESHGMLCSPQELGLPIRWMACSFCARTRSRTNVRRISRTSGSDVVYDLEVTPNLLISTASLASRVKSRGDGESAEAARNLSGRAAVLRCLPDAQQRVPTSDWFPVRIEDAELCPRTPRVLSKACRSPSPDWLKALWKKSPAQHQQRRDVTNYVMLETASRCTHSIIISFLVAAEVTRRTHRPIASSRRRLRWQPTIVVRRATAGEKFKTLDNVERALTNEMLLIAMNKKASLSPASWAARTPRSTRRPWRC